MSDTLVPATVSVGPIDITVVLDAQRCTDADAGYGFFHGTSAEIVLSPTVALTQQRDTLLHELLHAILEIVGATKGGDKALLADDDHEERLVSAISPFILALLRGNPDLIAYLIAEDK